MTGQRPSGDDRGGGPPVPPTRPRTNGYKPPRVPEEFGELGALGDFAGVDELEVHEVFSESVEDVDPGPSTWSPSEVLDAGAIGVVVFSSEGTAEYVNAAASALLPDCVVGMAFPSLPAIGTHWHGQIEERRVRGLRAELGDNRYAWYLYDTTAERRREDALLTERRRKVFLAEAGRVLATTTNPQRLTDLVTTLPAGELGDWVSLSVPSMEDGRVRTTFAPATGFPIGRVTTGLGSAWTALVGPGRVLRTGRHELHPLLDTALLRRLVPAAAIDELIAAQARCALILPVPTDDDAPSVLTFVRLATSDPFTEEEMVLAGEYAVRVGLALRTSRLYVEQERRTALLAEALLPGPLPEVPGARVAARYRPVTLTNGLGGDFYAIHTTADPATWAFSVGDVCGRGTPVGMFSSRSLLVLRTAANAGCSPSRRMALLDAELALGDPMRVLTAITGDVTPHPDGSATIRLTCAGHPPPLWMDPAGRVRAMEYTDPLVAGIPGTVYSEREFTVPAGSTLLLYSDGVTEARSVDGTEYGVGNLRHDLASCAGMPVEAIVDRLELRLMSHLGEIPIVDDVVLMAIHIPYRERSQALPMLSARLPPDPEHEDEDDRRIGNGFGIGIGHDHGNGNGIVPESDGDEDGA